MMIRVLRVRPATMLRMPRTFWLAWMVPTLRLLLMRSVLWMVPTALVVVALLGIVGVAGVVGGDDVAGGAGVVRGWW